MDLSQYWICLAIMAGSTYLLRALPFALVRRKIRNPFVRSFLHYIPYAVLTAMTIPAIFYATGSPIAAGAGFLAALVLALMGKGLTLVALAACAAVYATDLLLRLF